MLSVIIPSRNEIFLQKTVDDLLLKAEGEVEVIIVLDGYWPVDYDWSDPRIKIIHHGTVHDSIGMRDSINDGMAIASGDYVMKIDEHCMVGQGYDLVLAADCEDDYVVIPRRYRLDPDNWELIEDGRPPIDYMIIDYPYQRPNDKTCGLHGAEDKEAHFANIDKEIDDVMTMQGSCYFMSKKHWDNVIVKLESDVYGQFTQEAQEISNKTWLSGGRVIVNKKTFYAHWHKGKRGKGYGFSSQQYRDHAAGNEKGRLHCIDYWLNDRWDKRVRNFEWLIEKFSPIRGWDDNWKEQILIDKKKENEK